MGREVKRVALDFSWPLEKVWQGYQNPFLKYNKQCPFCSGSGLNEATESLADTWYDSDNPTRDRAWYNKITQDEVQALIDSSRLIDFTHNWTQENGWQKKDPEYVPTAEEVNAWTAIGFGHDAINRHICVKARATRLGVYGMCSYCKGDGSVWLSVDYEKKADEWKPCDPPSGDGFQIWETVSEGSPISPVFGTPEECASYMVSHQKNIPSDKGTTYQDWLAFIRKGGSVPSGVMRNGVIESGVTAFASVVTTD